MGCAAFGSDGSGISGPGGGDNPWGSGGAGVGGFDGSGAGPDPGSGGWYEGTGGGGGGFFGDEPEPRPDPDPVAPPDKPPTCDELDSSKPAVLYLSADDSNSMGSPVHARELLFGGVAPWQVRTYEFLNYYRIHYPAPPEGQLAIYPEASATATAGEYDFQLGIRSFDAIQPRRPMTVTFVLDTSGSMSGPPIERERAAVKAIAASLAQGDIVSMVTWNTTNSVIASGYAVTGPNDPVILQAADALSANGGTDLHSGLVTGYQLAQAHYGEARLNRVVLISDGGANVGITDEDIIGDHSQDADKEGIYLLGVGVGEAGSYNDKLMDVVTDRGRGAYVYLDSVEEAKAMFVDRFDETMEIAARAVQVELTLPWYFQIQKFSGEELSEDPEEIEPQHLAPSDAMVFNQVLHACAPEVVVPTDLVKVKVSWTTPLTYESKETSIEATIQQLLDAPSAFLPKGRAIVAYAEALKTGTKEALAEAHAQALVADESGTDAELAEIAALIEMHPAY